MNRELKVGNHLNNNQNEPPIIDLGVTPAEPTPAEPTSAEPTPEPIPEPANVDPTPVEPTPAEPNELDGVQPPVNNSSLTPNPEPVPQAQPEFNQEQAFKYLSEELGRDVKSLDDLKTVNPLDTDPVLKEIHEWRQKTGRDIKDWIKYQKDYSSMSDVDVAREFLKYEYPTLTNDEISLEMMKFIPNDDDMDNEAQMKTLELKKLATKGRVELNKLVSQFGEPTEGYQSASLTPEMKQDLELAQRVKQMDAQNIKSQEAYSQAIQSTSLSTESLEMKLSDDLTINFKVSDESKKSIPDMIATMPHWKNPDGSWNHQAVVNDAIKLKHHAEMLKLAFEQGVSVGKDNITRDANNITLDNPATMNSSPQGGKGVQIEGLDNFIGKKGVSIRKR